VERERAAAVLQLTAALLFPLYASLKRHDPVTKSEGKFNLYLHTAMVHVRGTIGKAYSNLRYISDDHIEGMIAELNRYFNRRTNNVSCGQSLVNKESHFPPRFHCQKEMRSTEKMLFTNEIVLCPCVVNVSRSAVDDFKAVVRFAVQEVVLSVAVAPSARELSSEEATLVASADAAVVAFETAEAAASTATAVATVALVNASTTAAETATASASAERASEGVFAAAVAAEAALVEIVGLSPL